MRMYLYIDNAPRARDKYLERVARQLIRAQYLSRIYYLSASGDPSVQICASGALANLAAADFETTEHIPSVLQAIINLSKSHHPDVLQYCARGLLNLSKKSKTRQSNPCPRFVLF